MDTARGLSRIPENPRLSSTSSDLDDELFLEVFDWSGYCESTQPFEKSSHAGPHYPSSRSSTRDLSALITEIPAVIGEYSLEKLQNEFFRMKAPFRPDDEVVSASEYSGQTPPDLVQGGSTSPSDHSGSGSVILDDAHFQSPDVTLREVQAQDDEWTYPQTEPSNKAGTRGYPPRLQVQEDQSRTAGTKRRRSGDDLNKRHRQLADPLQTADVRKSGACLPCRISKTRCQDNGVCPTCRKAFPDDSHLACTRLTPAMMWPVIGKVPDMWSKNAREEEQLCSGPQFYTGKPRDISIFFSVDSASPALHATVQAYRSQDGPEDASSVRTVNFPREKVPSYNMLQRWAESHIKKEQKSDFQHTVQKFLFAYSEDGYGLPKHALVSKVHKMNCFFRIWKTSTFYCRDPANKITPLPLSVQAQLRKIARKALDSLEHDIFRDLDDCVGQKGAPKPQEMFAVWASMWQLILMYQELLVAFKSHLGRIASAEGISHNHTAQLHRFNKLCDVFFPLLTIFYHYHFRTKKSLEVSLDWLRPGHHKTLRHIAEHLLDSRKKMYKDIQESKSELDRLLCVFVVNHELKKLNARKRPSKASSKSRKGIDDDCDNI